MALLMEDTGWNYMHMRPGQLHKAMVTSKAKNAKSIFQEQVHNLNLNSHVSLSFRYKEPCVHFEIWVH